MDKTIQMAREAGGRPSHNPELWDIWEISNKALKAFEALVRADERDKWMERAHTMILGEREACAKVCETEWSTTQEHVHGLALADEIRARGQA
jgi:hypothetical protein